MLFLLNDRVISIVGGAEVLNAAGLPISFATSCNLNNAIVAMQTAIMENPNLANADTTKAAALCWLINSRSGANAAMFVPAFKAKRPADVAYRLANVSLTILGSFKAFQEQGKLTTNTINQTVWNKVAA